MPYDLKNNNKIFVSLIAQSGLIYLKSHILLRRIPISAISQKRILTSTYQKVEIEAKVGII